MHTHIWLGALALLALTGPLKAQLTLTPEAAATRNAAISATQTNPNPSAPSGNASNAQAGATAPTADCTPKWWEIQEFARTGEINKQGSNCYIFAGPNVFKR
jgi:hypothetical protein